ncbi:MAG: LysR family transcriptional regulator, partial [Alcaligenes sp.]
MSITLRQLRAFLLVADTRHFTQAAAAMHITQSALSALIRELEGRLAVQLLDRNTRMVELTEAGRYFHQVAENVFNDLNKGINDLHELSTLQRGQVRIVASTVIASGLLSPCFKSFRTLYPNIKLSLHDVAEEAIAETAAAGSVDFGIGTCFELSDSLDLEESHLFDNKFIALCSKNHPLAQRK